MRSSPDSCAEPYFYDLVTGSEREDSPFGPRPNYSSPNVASYIAAQVTMWFDEYHADGLRWDSVSNIYNTWNGGVGIDPYTHERGISLPDGIRLLQNANATVASDWPAAFKIAEDLSGSKTESSDTQPVSSGGLGFDSQWNGTLAYYIRKDFPSTKPIKQSDVIAGISSNFSNDAFQSVVYFESHNELSVAGSRLIQLVDKEDPTSRTARKKQALAAAILFTTPGVPLVFQGDEFLDTSPADFKTPLNWSNLQNWTGFNALYASLAGLRTNAAGTTPGLTDPNLNIYQKDAINNVIAYDRYDQSNPGADDVIVVPISALRFSTGRATPSDCPMAARGR
jgi:1,4-alpha-glucan branching enzyme